MRKHIGELEQVILLAAVRLRDRAYAPGIRAEIEAHASRRVSRATLYRTLDRLEAKGLIVWVLEQAPPEDVARRGAPLRRFTVTDAGLEALRVSRRALLGLWSGIESVIDS